MALGTVTAIGGKVLLKMGMVAGLTAAEVEASRQMAWDNEFRTTLVSSTTKSCLDELKQNKEVNLETHFAPLKKYCDCYSTGFYQKLEDAHLIATKYNSTTTTEAEYIAEVSNVINQFTENPQVKNVLKECAAELKIELGRGSIAQSSAKSNLVKTE